MKIFKKIASGLRKIIVIVLILSLYLPLLLIPQNSQAATTTDPVVEIQNLNSQLADGLKNSQVTGGTESATTASNLVQVATDRRVKLKNLIINQPKDVSKVIIGDSGVYPADVQGILEKKTTETGYYTRLHSDYLDKKETNADFLMAGPDLAGPAVLLKSDYGHVNVENINKQITVSGYKLDGMMWFGGVDNVSLLTASSSNVAPNTSGPAAAGVNPPGTRSMAVLYVNFVDNRTRTLTNSQISDHVFGGGNSVKSFLEKSSNHLFTISGDVYLLDLDINKTCELIKWPFNLEGDLVAYSKNKATELGINLDNYTDKMIILDPTLTCSVGGESTLGPGWAFSIGFYAIAHEFGHNMYLQHAQGYECTNTFVSDNCREINYGNWFDVMGGSQNDFVDGDFGPYAKEFLGWLQPSEVTNVTASGTYTINTFEEPPTIPGPEYPARVLRLGLGADKPAYYIAYRMKNSLNAQGPVIELASGSLGSLRRTYLLDTTPGSIAGDTDVSDDGYLHDGQQVTDAFNGISFKGISHNTTSATIQVTYGQASPGLSSLNVEWDMATGYLSAVGQKKDMSWNPIRYIVDVKCSGYGCTGEWNQWSGCSSWPTGTCPPFDMTSTSVDIPVGSTGSGYSYQYRVWLLTRDDNNPNQAATYQWIGDTDASKNCGGPANCIQTLTWPAVTYKAYLYEKDSGLKACTGQIFPEVAGCQDFLYGSDITSFSFRGLPSGITFKGAVRVSDFSGNLHLLTDYADLGQSDSYVRNCSNSTGVTCTLPGYPNPQSFIGFEPILWSIKVNNQNGYIFSGPTLALSFADGSLTENWKWDYHAVVFPKTYSDCYAAGIECQVQSVYKSTASNFSFRFTGVRAGAEYRLIVCAYICNTTAGNPVVVDKIVISNPGIGPSFFSTDPFIEQPPTFACVFINAQGQAQKYGDVNNNGAVNASDATLVLRSYFGIDPQLAGDAKKAGDVNGNNILNASDATLIKRVVFGMDTKFSVCP